MARWFHLTPTGVAGNDKVRTYIIMNVCMYRQIEKELLKK